MAETAAPTADETTTAPVATPDAPDAAPEKPAKKKAGSKKPSAKKVATALLQETQLPMLNLLHPEGGCVIRSAKVNQRDHFPDLTAKGYPLFQEHGLGETDKTAVVEMLLSPDKLVRQEALDLLDELAPKVKEQYGSYAAHGILQNIEVRPRPDGYGDLVMGNLRVVVVAYAYAMSGGKINPEIPVSIRKLTDEDAATRSMTENLSRFAESPVDEARRLQALKTMGMQPKQIEAATGGTIKYQTILQRLKLLDKRIPEDVREKIHRGEMAEVRAIKKYIEKKADDRPSGTDGVRMPKYKDVYKFQYLMGVGPDGETKVPEAVRKWIALNYLEIPDADYKSVADCKAELDKMAKDAEKAKKKAAAGK